MTTQTTMRPIAPRRDDSGAFATLLRFLCWAARRANA